LLSSSRFLTAKHADEHTANTEIQEID